MNDKQFLEFLRVLIAEAHDKLPLYQRAPLKALHDVVDSRIKTIVSIQLQSEITHKAKKKASK